MITKELIDRINFLAQKQKSCGLTAEEKEEQSQVRRIYIDSIKAQVRDSLENAKSQEKHGHDCDCGHCH